MRQDGDLEDLLEARRLGPLPGDRAGKILAITLHALAITTAIVVPAMQAKPKAPLEFVAVQIIPAQRLGIEQPPPPKPEPEPEPAPTVAPAAPAPKKPEPVPTPKPTAPTVTPKPSAPEPAPPRAGSPQGSPQGAATGASIAGLDNPDFTYGYYVDQMIGLIRAKWQRPALGGGIEATLHFEIRRDGSVAEVRIVTSSGYSSFDFSGLRAVQAASPLPPLPRGYRRDSLGVTLIIR